jgi:hypothetical protein
LFLGGFPVGKNEFGLAFRVAFATANQATLNANRLFELFVDGEAAKE